MEVFTSCDISVIPIFDRTPAKNMVKLSEGIDYVEEINEIVGESTERDAFMKT